MGHTVWVGRLLLGHTALVWFGGWGRQVNMKTTPSWCVSGSSLNVPPVSVRFLIGFGYRERFANGRSWQEPECSELPWLC